MIVKQLKGTDVDIFFEKLDNGLKIYLAPFKNRKNYYIDYNVKYGSNVYEFISSHTNKKTKKPYGVAHFLEHKMFEQEDGMDPFSFFSQTGSDANASTSYDITSYIVDGVKNIEENLEFLLNYVNSPYFTDENVEKEKGIIIEELNMYKDQPENKLYDESNKALFIKHPIRIDIGGTPSSVNKITKEILYDCYDTFYEPNNIFITIAGNFDPEKVINIIKNNKKVNSKKGDKEIKVIKTIEPIEVKEREKEIKIKNIVIPKFVLNFKSPMKELTGEEKFKYDTVLDILLYILFGNSSEFREEMYRKELCTLLYGSGTIVDNVFVVEILAESKKPYELKEKVINCLKNKKITAEDVERIKKVKISLEVMDSDKPSKISYSMIRDITDFNEIIYNKIDIIKSITLEDVINVRKDIMLDNYSFVLGMPKK